MNVFELKERLAAAGGFTEVRLKLGSGRTSEVLADLTCVETVTEGRQQTILLSDDQGSTNQGPDRQPHLGSPT